jgi:hypothetical protein
MREFPMTWDWDKTRYKNVFIFTSVKDELGVKVETICEGISISKKKKKKKHE